jgi:signal transduction histidine kinase
MVDTPIAVEPPPSDPETARVDPPVVLVVDDEEFVLRALQRLLRPRYEVLTAACPSDALKLLEAREVQIVMSDQRMPETSGVEFLARVRALYPNSVRILFTGYADVQAAIETINLGKVYGYISKPWDPQQLELMLAQALEHHRLSEDRRRLLAQLQRNNAELQRRNEELREANERLLDLDRLKSVFMEVASHELNTPTSVIQGYAHLLQRELDFPPESIAARAIRAIRAHASRLERTTGNILKVLVSDAPQHAPHRERVLALGLLRQTEAALLPFLDKRTQRLELECDPELWLWVDPQQLADALVHLTVNAIKFSPDGATIALRAHRAGQGAQLQVVDRGMGVDPKDERGLFQAFFNSFDAKHHSSGEFEYGKRGIGLGLALVRKYAELHGGAARYEPGRPSGAVFTLSLPEGAVARP